MRKHQDARVEPWMLFAFPTAIAVPIIAGILLGGPFLGLLAAAVVAAVIAFVAIRMQPPGWRSRAAREEASVREASGMGPRPAGPGGDWRSAAARRFVLPVIIAVAGIVLIVAGEGDTLGIIGWGVVAVALTVAISLVFLEIGYSEDRARAREQRFRSAGRPPGGQRFGQ